MQQKHLKILLLVLMSFTFQCSAQSDQSFSSKKNIYEIAKSFTIEELRTELNSRAAGIPKDVASISNNQLRQYSTNVIYSAYIENQKAIYRVDNRVEAPLSAMPMRANINKVVGFFDRKNIRDNKDGTVSIVNYSTFGTMKNLCKTEKFRVQPAVAFCSGFAVSEDIIASAGHCVNSVNDTLDESTLNDIVLIFGFYQTSGGPILRFKNEDVYYPVRGIRKLENKVAKGKDYLLLKVNRNIPKERIVKLSETAIQQGQKVYVIGHPSGLPMKCADGAYVRDNSNANCFVSNLDTYGGNSGSPVFNAESNRVEGILVRGETDFVNNGGCLRSNICPDNGCLGEDVTRTSIFYPTLRALIGHW
jgi:V8-like Glu-specific endopeptidase